MSATPASAPQRRSRNLTALFVVLLICGSAYLPVTHHLRAASALLRISNPQPTGLLANYKTNSVSIQDTAFSSNGQSIPARLYVPVGAARPAAMVVIPGVHHLGYDEPRLRNFASALASHGMVVLTPQVADFADYHVTTGANQVVGDSALALSERTNTPRVGLLGLSFAGGTALITAADPRYADHIAFVAAVGAHADLARVLRYYATGELPLPDGSTQRLPAHEYGPLVVIYSHPEAFFSTLDAAQARIAIRYLLWEDLPRAHLEAAKLSPDGQRRMNLLFEHRTDTIAPEILANIDTHKSEISEASPQRKLASLRMPVFLLHGAADNVVPPGETLWLEKDIPPGLVRERLISPVVSHVELGDQPAPVDYLRLVHWMSELLSEADQSARPPQ